MAHSERLTNLVARIERLLYFWDLRLQVSDLALNRNVYDGPRLIAAISRIVAGHVPNRIEDIEVHLQMDPCTGGGDSMDNRESMKMSYELLKTITDGFAKDRLLGSGTFGMVYKGTYANGEDIAVKVLRDMAALDEKNFRNEFENLAELKHQNIVQLVGYCNESEEQIVDRDDGTRIKAEKLHVALCFEFVDNGSLHKHIKDETQGLEWHIRYKIIKGVCLGLKHLREGLEKPVWHLDLKPDNILLDKEMMPKIADFGLSRLIGDERTRKTMNDFGTCGYRPPEYVSLQLLSEAFDIFSLGVIITKIMIGNDGYHKFADLPHRKLINQVRNNWMKRLQHTVRPGSLDAYCLQVKTCIDIAKRCLNEDRHQRPDIKKIVSTLDETETMIPLQIEQLHYGATVPPSNESTTVASSSGRDAEVTTRTKNKLNLPTLTPKELPFKLLESITNGFSNDRELGRGTYGTVFKGVYEDGQVIAVKILREMALLVDGKLESEVKILSKAQHENIIQLVGFCYEPVEIQVEYTGRIVLAQKIHRALCFEYMQNGSLQKYICDVFDGLDWFTRYKIIKGTCEGLRYLHEELGIVHFDLKPNNILLDENMVPKIGNFAHSRLLGTQRTPRTISPVRTPGYIPPEYIPPEFIKYQIISKESDIFSLGVIIIEVILGRMGYSLTAKMTYRETIQHVLGKWRKRLEATLKARSVELYLQQVKKCIEIACKCIEEDRRKRPNIGEIVRTLDERETLIRDDTNLLDMHPMELCFPFRPKKHASCLLQLLNKHDDRVAFMLNSNSPKGYLTKLPLCGVVPPRCKYTLALTTSKQPQRRPSDSDEADFVLQSIAVSDHQEHLLKGLDQPSAITSYCRLFEINAGDEVQEVTLMSVYAPVAEEASSKLTRQEIEIITIPDARQVLSIEVHPKEPWIMTTHIGGNLRVWNYQTMDVLKPFEIPDEPVYVAKFIVQEEWIAAGGENGHIYVCSYEENQDAMNFEAHSGRIMSLVVHPTDRYVLSSSHDDHLIKLWQWDEYWDFEKGWMCTRTFEGHSDKVSRIIYNPEESGSFISASLDGTVKVWGLDSDVCNSTLDKYPGGLLCVDYLTGAECQHLITGSKDGTAQIWDLKTKGRTENLQGHADHISVVYYHPELQKLITGSLDGTVRIWDSTTYRLDNIIALNLGSVYDFGYIEELQRTVVGCHQGIALMDVNSIKTQMQTKEDSK